MGMLTKVMVVVNMVLAIAVAVFAFTLWSKQISWVKDLGQVTEERNALQAAKSRLEANASLAEKRLADQTAEFERVKTGLERDRAGLQAANETLQATTTKLTSNLSNLDATLKSIQLEKDEINEKMAALTKERDQFRSEADSARELAGKAERAAVGVAAELQAATDQTRSLMERLRKLMERVDQQEVLVSRYVDIYGALGSDVAGEVVNIDGVVTKIDRETNLLVINSGEAKGVRKGMIFTLSRGDHYLGRALVRSVHPEMAVLAISDMTPDPLAIEVGDIARTM